MSNGLLDALKAIGWPDLPKAIDADYKKTWIQAIVKVRKYNGMESYALAVNDGDGKPRIIRDFGPAAIIAEVLSIHPYKEVESKAVVVPRFVNDAQRIKYLHKFGHKDDDIAALLSKEGKTPEQIKADRETVDGYLEQAAIKQERRLAEAEEEAAQLIAAADPKIIEKQTKARKYGRTATRKTQSSKS